MKNKILLGLVVFFVLVLSTFSVNTVTNAQAPTLPKQVFSIYMLAPNTNPARNAWSLLMSEELPKIGIGVDLFQLGWTLVIPRTFGYEPATPADGIPTFKDGGYDIFFIGLSGSLVYDPFWSYSSNAYSPQGNNFAYFKNSTMDTLISQYDSQLDPTLQQPIGYQIQQIAYDQAPYIPIMNTGALWAFDSKLPWTQTDFLMLGTLNYASYFSKLGTGTLSSTDIVYEDPYQLGEWMPNIVQSYISDIYIDPQISAMYERNPNDPNYALQPVMAAGMPIFTTPDANGKLNMTVNIRNDVTFSNGDHMTAWDVVNTYHMAMTASFGFVDYSAYATYLDTATYGNDSVQVVNATQIVFHLAQPYFLAITLANEAVLDHTVTGWFNATDWNPTTHAWNDYNTANTKTMSDINANAATMAVFTGPYMYATGTDFTAAATSSNIKIVANPNWWAKGNGQWYSGAQQITSMAVNFQATKDAAVADLAGGKAQVLDGQYYLVPGDIQGQSGISSFTVLDFGTQMMTVNMHHPIMGTGVDTPLGKADPSKAALAAKYIRQAIAYVTPQQDIIDSIAKGIGAPGTTLWPNLAAGYDSNIPLRQYDLAKAKALMTLAGYDLTVSSSSSSGGFLPFVDALQIFGIGMLVSTVVVANKRKRRY